VKREAKGLDLHLKRREEGLIVVNKGTTLLESKERTIDSFTTLHKRSKRIQKENIPWKTRKTRNLSIQKREVDNPAKVDPELGREMAVKFSHLTLTCLQGPVRALVDFVRRKIGRNNSIAATLLRSNRQKIWTFQVIGFSAKSILLTLP
jgi:hypothetical protein